jgi:hypothetical protein
MANGEELCVSQPLLLSERTYKGGSEIKRYVQWSIFVMAIFLYITGWAVKGVVGQDVLGVRREAPIPAPLRKRSSAKAISAPRRGASRG